MDQYTVRTGANFHTDKLTLSGGIRLEGIPVHDLVGGSNGNRRVGYNLSIEPGVIFNMKKTSFYVFVPVILKRETKQSIPDKIMTDITGVYTLTQGGFADYLVFVGASFKL